jgi:hypothetical protein
MLAENDLGQKNITLQHPRKRYVRQQQPNSLLRISFFSPVADLLDTETTKSEEGQLTQKIPFSFLNATESTSMQPLA